MLNKVVVGVDGGPGSKAAVRWCAERLARGAKVIAVCGIAELGEFAMSLPPFEIGDAPITDCLKSSWCEPLRRAGFEVEARVVHHGQAAALVEVAEAERPDVVVVGQLGRNAIASLFFGRDYARLIHRPPCPVVIVPVDESPDASMSAGVGGAVETGAVETGEVAAPVGQAAER